MPTYTLTARNLEHSPVLTATVTADTLARAVRLAAREIVGRPYAGTATAGSVEMPPSSYPTGWRPATRYAVVRCRDGCELGRIAFARADGERFPPVR